jgi:hypothetical protein
MSPDTETAAQTVRTRSRASTARLRRASLALLALLVIEYGFVSSGNAADSLAMSVLTGVALLCYAANLYLLPEGRATA